MDLKKIKRYAEAVKQEAQGLNRTIISNVVGVTLEDRQLVLAQVEHNTELKLERDRSNPHDFYAVKVMAAVPIEDDVTPTWQQVGFLPRKMAQLVSKSLDKKRNCSAEVFKLKGGFETGEGTAALGLEIRIIPEE